MSDDKIKLVDAHEATKWMEQHYLKPIKNQVGCLVAFAVFQVIVGFLVAVFW